MTEFFIKNIEYWDKNISEVTNEHKFVDVLKRVSYLNGNEVDVDYPVHGFNFKSDSFEVDKVEESEIEEALENALERLEEHIKKELDVIMKEIRNKEISKLREKHCYYALYNRLMKRNFKLMNEEASPSSS